MAILVVERRMNWTPFFYATEIENEAVGCSRVCHLQRMYLGPKGNAEILLKIFSEKQRQRPITYGTYDSITVKHETHGQNIQI
jgi:hypothetical protein